MTIAGSDSSAGAGIQGDLKTFAAIGVYGTSVITAITAQNTVEVKSIQGIKPQIVKDQIQAILDDFPIKAIKIGMLYSEDIIHAVYGKLIDLDNVKIVLDPVMISTSGSPLLDKNAILSLREKLFPIATVITPNIPEMEALIAREINSEEDFIRSSKQLYEESNSSILLKGGHRKDKAVDLLYTDNQAHWFRGAKIKTKSDHGTGCSLSSAITAFLAQGESLIDAVSKAKDYVRKAMENAYPLGKGHGPINHFWNFKEAKP